MLSRHKKAHSDMKSAEKKLKDPRTKQTKTREALGKGAKGYRRSQGAPFRRTGTLGVVAG
jgi:hypothetical protein